MSPAYSGSTRATGSGEAPLPPTAAGTSITASSGRKGGVPRLQVFTTWYGEPAPPSRAAARSTAASE
ncbi:hypothetical protein STENM327S_01140 [Streptomyces tendae]